MPMTRNAAFHHQASLGVFSARRWSSQIMAGRKGWPCLSNATVVPRCVVTTTPAIAVLGTVLLAHNC